MDCPAGRPSRVAQLTRGGSRRPALILLLTACLLSPAATRAQDDYGSHGNAWAGLTAEQRTEVEALADRFGAMIDVARTEALMVRESVRWARDNGFREWDPEGAAPQPGDRFYAVNRGRTIVLWVQGREPMTAGMRLVNSHIDSVRLELKPHPLRERAGVVTLDTLQHGGLKGYQWVNVPLAITGRVDKKDGSTVWIEIGLDEDDPVLLIPDLAPHVDKDYRDRPRSEAIQTEELDPILLGSDDGSGASLVAQAEQLIRERYGIEPGDWVSADVQIVPATRPRDIGLDRSLIGAFGLDDRLTGVVNLLALGEIDSPQHTAMAYLVTDEEVGSRWNVGVSSEWFRRLVSEIVRAESGEVSELDLMNAFSATDQITADTTTATNPLWPDMQAPGNAALMHHGLVIKLYGPGRSANSEYVARLRALLDDADTPWQTHSYAAGYGGGTIASTFASMNMEVSDWGVGIWSMHSTYDVASKADIWSLYKGFVAFFGS